MRSYDGHGSHESPYTPTRIFGVVSLFLFHIVSMFSFEFNLQSVDIGVSSNQMEIPSGTQAFLTSVITLLCLTANPSHVLSIPWPGVGTQFHKNMLDLPGAGDTRLYMIHPPLI